MTAAPTSNGHVTITVTVQCPYCAWTVLITGNLRAVAQDLGAHFAAHVTTDHPELLLPAAEGRPP